MTDSPLAERPDPHGHLHIRHPSATTQDPHSGLAEASLAGVQRTEPATGTVRATDCPACPTRRREAAPASPEGVGPARHQPILRQVGWASSPRSTLSLLQTLPLACKLTPDRGGACRALTNLEAGGMGLLASRHHPQVPVSPAQVRATHPRQGQGPPSLRQFLDRWAGQLVWFRASHLRLSLRML